MERDNRFLCSIGHASQLKSVFSSMTEFAKVITLEVTVKGWEFFSYDETGIASVYMELHKDAFDTYDFSGKRVQVGLNTKFISQVLNNADNLDLVTFEKLANSDYLRVKIQKAGSCSAFEVNCKLMEPNDGLDGKVRQVRELSDEWLEMPSAEFARVVSDLKSWATEMRIESGPNGIQFSSSGDAGSGTVNFKARTEDGGLGGADIRVHMTKTFNQTFNQRYLESFSKACHCNSDVTMHFTDEAHLTVRFPLADNQIRKEEEKASKKALKHLAAGGGEGTAQPPPQTEMKIREGLGLLQFEICSKMSS